MDPLDVRLDSVAADLEKVAFKSMFFGAGVLHRYLDEPAVLREPLRPTEDVDAMLQVAVGGSPREAVMSVEAELLRCGWHFDLREHRRNAHAYITPAGIAVDVVVDATLGSDDWVVLAQASAELQRLPNGRVIRLPAPAYYLISKLEASRSPARWEGPYDSHDLEDVAQLIAGCTRLRASVAKAPEDARAWLRAWSQGVLDQSTFGKQTYACLEGNWPGRVPIDNLDRFIRDLAAVEGGPVRSG